MTEETGQSVVPEVGDKRMRSKMESPIRGVESLDNPESIWHEVVRFIRIKSTYTPNRCTLSPEITVEIARKSISSLSDKVLGQEYGVSRKLVFNLRRRVERVLLLHPMSMSVVGVPSEPLTPHERHVLVIYNRFTYLKEVLNSPESQPELQRLLSSNPHLQEILLLIVEGYSIDDICDMYGTVRFDRMSREKYSVAIVNSLVFDRQETNLQLLARRVLFSNFVQYRTTWEGFDASKLLIRLLRGAQSIAPVDTADPGIWQIYREFIRLIPFIDYWYYRQVRVSESDLSAIFDVTSGRADPYTTDVVDFLAHHHEWDLTPITFILLAKCGISGKFNGDTYDEIISLLGSMNPGFSASTYRLWLSQGSRLLENILLSPRTMQGRGRVFESALLKKRTAEYKRIMEILGGLAA